MTRVRKAAAVSLMTPMAAAAIAVGLNQSAVAADACPPLASASIMPPNGTVTAGSSVHVSAKITGLMLLQAHLQISGLGLDKQVGKSVNSGEIQGDVTVPQAGYFTLAVVGNGTQCTYQTKGFSVKERPHAPSPSHSGTASSAPRPGGGGKGSSGGLGSLPTGSAGSGASGSGNLGLNPLNGASPFSLPSVAPDGSSQGFEYPSPDPQVASPPPGHVVARNVSQTTPIKWGQSLAVALVLLMISAHLGMWSRRQRLAAEGAAGGGKRAGRKKALDADATVAAATALADPVTETMSPVDRESAATASNAPTTQTTDASNEIGMFEGRIGAEETAEASPAADAPVAEPADATSTGDAEWEKTKSRRSGGRGYQGRRRRG